MAECALPHQLTSYPIGGFQLIRGRFTHRLKYGLSLLGSQNQWMTVVVMMISSSGWTECGCAEAPRPSPQLVDCILTRGGVCWLTHRTGAVRWWSQGQYEVIDDEPHERI